MPRRASLHIDPRDAADDTPCTAATAVDTAYAASTVGGPKDKDEGPQNKDESIEERIEDRIADGGEEKGSGAYGVLESAAYGAAESPARAVGLPDGCTHGSLPQADGSEEPVIWVDFPTGSRENPFYFSKGRKLAITVVATFFTFMTAYTTSCYSISARDMCAELGCTTLQIESGIALYCWGFAIAPLALAPISEELGRQYTYITAVVIFFLLQLMMTLGKNTATILVCRFLLGLSGSIGATLVGGTISDIFVPSQRGLPMALFGFCAIFGTGLGGPTMAEVTVALGWRWVHWLQFILMGAFCPVVFVTMRETRATVILRRQAAKLRAERGDADGGRYLARCEVDKIKFSAALKQSLLRPLIFLVTEPLVTFFSLWIAVAWGVFYIQIAGIPYAFSRLHGFGTISLGYVYWTLCIGGVLGFIANFVQDRVYRARAPKKGVEARLYAPMVAGIMFAVGCYIMGFTSLASIHWIGPCVGITILITGIMIIYITAFTYLGECYGAYASSALAAQSFLRNMLGGAFSFVTTAMFDGMTVRWALVAMGGVATLLALVPFAAYVYGPQIRAHSKYSRQLMAEERAALEKERIGREKRGMDTAEAEDLEGGANEEAIERAMSRTSHHSRMPRRGDESV